MEWPVTVEQALHLQELHRPLVRIVPLERPPRFVAGIDAAFSGDRIYAAVCVYDYPGLSPVEQAHAVIVSHFPYVPGYLLFREGPALVAAFNSLKQRPDVLLVDGQGIAHPLGIGSASHLGVLLDIPTIGCAKTRLIGEYWEPGELKGSMSALRINGRSIGVVLRTKDRVKPLFVSPGHKVDIQDAAQIVLECSGKYRMPEPLRCADMLSRKIRTAKRASSPLT